MIEFNQDGPFAEKADQLFPDRVRIVGLGQTGAAVCDQLKLHGGGHHPDLWVFDSDQQVVEGSIVPNKHLLGERLIHGLGCNGDRSLARDMVAIEQERLLAVTRGCDFLILVLGFAGATGTALAEHLIPLGRKAGAKVIVVGAQPFTFEGSARRDRSTEAVALLRAEADSVLVLSQDRLTGHPAMKSVRHGFHVMHQLMAQAAQALAQIVCKRGLIQLSFADVRSLYARYAAAEVLENCWVAHCESDLNRTPQEVVAELVTAPQWSDATMWEQVDHAIVAISGTREVGLSDVQEMVGALKESLPVDIPIATSASLDEEGHENVRLTVLLARTKPALAALDPEPPVPLTQLISPIPPAAKPRPPVITPPESEPEEDPIPAALVPEPASRAARRFSAKQEEMQFEGPTRGRFEKTHETIYRGENLDQPTFRRRRLAIRL